MLSSSPAIFVVFMCATVLSAEPAHKKEPITVPPAFEATAPDWLKILPAGSDQSKPYMHRILPGSTPMGKALRPNPLECSNLTLEHLLALSDKAPQTQVSVLQGFFNRCEKTLSRFAPTKLGAIMSLVNQNYDITQRPELSEVVFKLPFNIKIHGLLGVKPDLKPRPLVIVVSGTGGDLSDISARAMLGALFDETPFNVLVLPSSTSSPFISDNHVLILGGFEESRIVFEIIKLMAGDDSPYRKLISSFHVAGVSLGGNASLFTGVYATYNPLPANQPQIQSILGYCPAVDLETSMDDLDRKDMTGKLYRKIIEGDTVGKSKFLDKLIPDPLPQEKFRLGSHQNIKFTEAWITPSLKDLVKRPGFLLPPFNVETPETQGQYWADNNYLNFANTVQIPTVLFASDDDFVVNPYNNSLALEEKLRLYKSDSPIAVFHPKKGWHCMMTQTYGEDIFSTSVRGIVLANSPEYQLSKTHLAFSAEMTKQMKAIGPKEMGERFFGYHWHVHAGSSTANLIYEIYTPQKQMNQADFCDKFSPYNSFEGCFRKEIVKVPLALFDSADGAQKGTSRPQAEALTRWLNAHVRVLGRDGNEPVDTTRSPVSFEVTAD